MKHIVIDMKHIVIDMKHVVIDMKHVVIDMKHVVIDMKHGMFNSYFCPDWLTYKQFIPRIIIENSVI